MGRALSPDQARSCAGGAAARAHRGRAQALLALGAGVDARDRGAATPLFAACELSAAAAAAELLAAGADAGLRNSAGEAPLYIAALRGYGGVVRVLLAHAQRAGLPWVVRAALRRRLAQCRGECLELCALASLRRVARH